MENTISIPVIILTLGFFSFLSSAQRIHVDDGLLDYNRRPHDFGLGKRVRNSPQDKRLPIYNFGLGKRSELLDDSEDTEEYDDYIYYDEDQIPAIELYQDDSMQSLSKRPKLYNFGLGKRGRPYDFGLGKRHSSYDFGLGKREYSYDFGLGKREPQMSRLYNFGLGKRNDKDKKKTKKVPPLYSFGLGRRSESFDASNTAISKREVHEQSPEEMRQHNDDNNQPGTDYPPTGNKFEKPNNTAELESHEIMGHSEREHVIKRAPARYNYEGKNQAYGSNSAFSRQFRKPLYNFGLGKRDPVLPEINYKSSK